jgi:hypothetical protein
MGNPIVIILVAVLCLWAIGGGYYGHSTQWGWGGNAGYGYGWGGGGLILALVVLWLLFR